MQRTVIIGGGAAGLCAAVLLTRAGLSCTLLEALPRVGKKLLATGNGRCNLSNLHAAPEHYRGDPALLESVLRFSCEDARRFFASLGIPTFADPEGRVYPRSEQAAAVLDALRLAAVHGGAEVLTDCPAESLQRTKNRYLIAHAGGKIAAERVIFACGGRAASPRDGFSLLEALGVPVTRLSPALCPVPVSDPVLKSLKGLRVRAAVRVLEGERVTAARTGEVQFADRALSGICVFDLALAARKKGAALSLDLLPDCEDPHSLVRELAALPFRTAEDFLSGLLPRRIGSALMRGVHEGPMTDPSAALPDRELDAAARTLKDWRFTPAGEPAWSAAQVTHGGVPAAALDPETLEVRDFPGLYIVGEAADVDGDCGGFNLHWAWASAHAAARAAARAVIGRVDA